jgi:hypothetical protein
MLVILGEIFFCDWRDSPYGLTATTGDEMVIERPQGEQVCGGGKAENGLDGGRRREFRTRAKALGHWSHRAGLPAKEIPRQR